MAFFYIISTSWLRKWIILYCHLIYNASFPTILKVHFMSAVCFFPSLRIQSSVKHCIWLLCLFILLLCPLIFHDVNFLWRGWVLQRAQRAHLLYRIHYILNLIIFTVSVDSICCALFQLKANSIAAIQYGGHLLHVSTWIVASVTGEMNFHVYLDVSNSFLKF